MFLLVSVHHTDGGLCAAIIPKRSQFAPSFIFRDLFNTYYIQYKPITMLGSGDMKMYCRNVESGNLLHERKEEVLHVSASLLAMWRSMVTLTGRILEES